MPPAAPLPPGTPPPADRRGTLRRVLPWLVLAAAVLAATALGYVGWIFSEEILVPQPYGLQPEFEIVATDADRVTLPLPPNERQFADTRKAGRVNLIWATGAGRLGPVLAETDAELVREFDLLRGRPPEPGQAARLDVFLWRGLDPARAHGLAFDDVRLTGEAGDLRAWWLPGEGETAVLMLHGRRRADLSELLRVMPLLVERGYPVLALAYRNHDASAPSPDGFYHYGDSEWRDVIAGLDALAETGADRVVVVAYSYGAVLALEAVEALADGRALAAAAPIALVLDSPFLDPREVVYQGARNRGLPFPERIADLALAVARLRSGVVWSRLDQRRTAPQHTLPLLLIHPVDDRTIPIALSDAFADAYGGPVSYHRVEGADHTEAWNLDPVAYEGWLAAFLDEHAPRGAR